MQLSIFGLLGQGLGPVHGQVELAATVVQLAGAGGGRFAVFQQLSSRSIQCFGQNGGLGIACFDSQIFERHGKRQEFTQRIPAQVILLRQLLYVLRSRAARTRFVHAAACHQRHDRQHFGAGSEFHDGEQVGQIIAQDVSGDGDGVQPANDALQAIAHGTHLGHVLNIQARGVVVFEVFIHLLDELVLMGAVRVEPEHGRCLGVAGAGDRELDPIAHGSVLALAHAPNVAFTHILGEQHFTCGDVHNIGNAGFADFKCLVVGAVFFCLLRHQTHIGHGAHGFGVKVAMPFAEVNDLLVDAGKGALRHHRLHVLQAAVGSPHLAAVPDHGGHGGIHNDVVG